MAREIKFKFRSSDNSVTLAQAKLGGGNWSDINCDNATVFTIGTIPDGDTTFKIKVKVKTTVDGDTIDSNIIHFKVDVVTTPVDFVYTMDIKLKTGCLFTDEKETDFNATKTTIVIGAGMP